MKYDARKETGMAVVVNHNPYWFFDLRIDRDTVPEDMVVYEAADANDGRFWRISRGVMVNFWGTLIGFDKIPEIEDCGYYYPKNGNWEELCIDDDYCEDDPEFSQEEIQAAGYTEEDGDIYITIDTGELISKADWEKMEDEVCFLDFHGTLDAFREEYHFRDLTIMV